MHFNSKHTAKHANSSENCDYGCPLCGDKLGTIQDLNNQKSEEIENMDVPSLTNYLFECNLCSFASGQEDSAKEHMIEHVNSKPKKAEETVKQNNNDIICSFEGIV